MYTTDEIAAIAAMPDTAFKYKQQFQSLLNFYLWIRDNWTATAIKELASENGLSLRSHLNQAKFARLAAQIIVAESQPVLCPQIECPNPIEPIEPDNAEIIRPIALISPTPLTNGLENAPAWKILGSPISRTELEQNFKKLLWYWHPDKNSDPSAEDRMSLIASIYRLLTLHWEAKYSPLLPARKLNSIAISRAMDKTFDWSPESFWTDELRSKSFESLKSSI